MKITHISLCGPVTDNWTYQDNLLPKFHKKLGYVVSVITSQNIWNENGELALDKRDTYYNEYNIKTIRIKIRSGNNIHSKFKRYKNLYSTICSEKPNIIFLHGFQFIDVNDIVKYKRKYPEVKLYVDNHADFSNSATNWISKNILHKIIWRYFAKKISRYVEMFYGVLPSRVDFLKEVYNIQEKKVRLLLMGADDDKVIEARDINVRNKLREKYCIKPDDFLIITGGKIDNAKKQTLLLMEAVRQIPNENVKLIVFGSVIDELVEGIKVLTDEKKIQYIGWIKPEDSYKYFSASDLAVFPGRHSVFWEQVVGLGIPIIVKYWEGTNHVDLDGNCIFLYNDNAEEITEKISYLVNNQEVYKEMKNVSEKRGIEEFSYYNIAKRSIINQL